MKWYDAEERHICSDVQAVVLFLRQYALYKKMTLAAILIQSKFRSYYEQKKFQQSRRAAMLIQQYYRSYKELGRPNSHSHAAAAAALMQHKLRYEHAGNHKQKAEGCSTEKRSPYRPEIVSPFQDSKVGPAFCVGGAYGLSPVNHSGTNQSLAPVRLMYVEGVDSAFL